MIELVVEAAAVGTATAYTFVPTFRTALNDKIALFLVRLPLPVLKVERLRLYQSRLYAAKDRIALSRYGLEFDLQQARKRAEELREECQELDKDLGFYAENIDGEDTTEDWQKRFEDGSIELSRLEGQLIPLLDQIKELEALDSAAQNNKQLAQDGVDEFAEQMMPVYSAARYGRSAADARIIASAAANFIDPASPVGRLAEGIMRDSYIEGAALADQSKKISSLPRQRRRKHRLAAIYERHGLAAPPRAELRARTKTALPNAAFSNASQEN